MSSLAHRCRSSRATILIRGLTVPTLLLMTCMPIKQTFRRMRALAILLIFLLWAFVGISISPASVGASLTSWLLMLDYLAVSVLAINLLTTRRRLIGLIDAILLMTTFVSLYGIYGYITKQMAMRTLQPRSSALVRSLARRRQRWLSFSP